jgi:hypothetical protein
MVRGELDDERRSRPLGGTITAITGPAPRGEGTRGMDREGGSIVVGVATLIWMGKDDLGLERE